MKNFYILKLYIKKYFFFIERDCNINYIFFSFNNDFVLSFSNYILADYFQLVYSNDTRLYFLIFDSKQFSLKIKNYFFTLLKNIYKGVVIKLIIFGRNYKFILENTFLIIFLGFCHYIYLKIPSFVKVYLSQDKNTEIFLYSIYRAELLHFCFKIKKLYKRDVYKRKGIFMLNDSRSLKRKKKKEF